MHYIIIRILRHKSLGRETNTFLRSREKRSVKRDRVRRTGWQISIIQISKKNPEFRWAFPVGSNLDSSLFYHSYHYYHHHYHIHHRDIIIIILVNKKIKYLISYNVVIVYCSLFQEMKLVLHKLAEKMLPIALFLCFAALTVHSENSDIPRT